MFEIADGRKELFQWDKDIRLIVNDASIPEVHFCNKTDDCSLVCEVFVEDGVRLVNIPNVLLQNDWTIRVYAYTGNYTLVEKRYKPITRSKPADYVYTETELKNWDRIVELSNEVIAAANAATEAAYTAASGIEDIANQCANSIVVSASGIDIDIRDSAYKAPVRLRVYGKTTQAATPTIDKPQELEHGEITVEQYYTFNEININIPDGLAGVPVSKAGSWKDANGQYWISDIYDSSELKHYKFIETITIGESADFKLSGLETYTGYYYFYYNMASSSGISFDGCLCDKLPTKHYETAWTDNSPGEFFTIKPSNDNSRLIICVNILKSRVNKYSGETSLDKFKNFLKENPLTAQIAHTYAFETEPVVLTEAEEAQYKEFKIHTKYTKVYTNKKSYLILDYIADTKTYIDNKIAALK